jgi:hypothetical protein
MPAVAAGPSLLGPPCWAAPPVLQPWLGGAACVRGQCCPNLLLEGPGVAVHLAPLPALCEGTGATADSLVRHRQRKLAE